MAKVYLLLGSNEGESKSILSQAIAIIDSECGKISQKSSFYKTAAWGKEDQDPFLNIVIEIESTRSSMQLLHLCQQIENALGRVRSERWGSRKIDIDILYFDNEIIDTQELKIPHPEIKNRKFTLIPMNEIAAEYTDPKLDKTIKELLDECQDPLSVEKIRD